MAVAPMATVPSGGPNTWLNIRILIRTLMAYARITARHDEIDG